MLSSIEKEMLDNLDNDVVRGLITSLDDSIDMLQTVIGELEQKVRQLENRLDNV